MEPFLQATAINSEDISSNDVCSATPKRMRGIAPEFLNTELWPTMDEGALTEARCKTYLGRKRAVVLFLQGSSETTIKSLTGLSMDYIRRLIRQRCVETHPDGRLVGWRGLVPYNPDRDYVRLKRIQVDKWGKGASGALAATFVACADFDLQKQLDKRILKAAREAAAGEETTQLKLIRFEKQRLFRWFLNALRQQQYEVQGKWPFNTERQGYVTICRYIDKVLKAHPRAMVSSKGGAQAVTKMKSGDGVERPILEPFFRVECDAHKRDGRYIVLVPTPDGGFVERLVHRLWVIVILEVVSRAVLGYYLSSRREVSSGDVLATIKHALKKWRRRNISFSDSAYHPDAGFPSSVDDQFIGACWDEFSVDGALAETCKRVKDKLENVVGAKLVSPYNDFSVRRAKDDRPFVESFFRTLEQGGQQRLSNSTGGKPSEKHGRDPAKVAISSRFQLEYAQELLDVEIANYNATPHSAMPNRSPLQTLEFYLKTGRLKLRHADSNEIDMLLSKRELREVHGGAENGRRPYVNYENAKYSSDLLRRRYDLIGQRIWLVQPDENDARFVRSSTEKGVDLGLLRAAPPWHRTPHSVFVRKTCQSLARKRLIYLSSHTDPYEQFAEYVANQTDKKLPPHPAYLEWRRIMQAYAEELAIEPMLADTDVQSASGATVSEYVPDCPEVAVDNSTCEKNAGGKEGAKPLPARRKVVQT